MHNPESLQENETHKLLWDFQLKTDHLLSARRSVLIIIKKKKRENFAFLADHRVKLKENNKKDKQFDLDLELKKTWNMKVTVTQIVIGVISSFTRDW